MTVPIADNFTPMIPASKPAIVRWLEKIACEREGESRWSTSDLGYGQIHKVEFEGATVQVYPAVGSTNPYVVRISVGGVESHSLGLEIVIEREDLGLFRRMEEWMRSIQTPPNYRPRVFRMLPDVLPGFSF